MKSHDSVISSSTKNVLIPHAYGPTRWSNIGRQTDHELFGTIGGSCVMYSIESLTCLVHSQVVHVLRIVNEL